MRASATGNVDFGGMEVGPGALIGPPEAYFAQPGFSGGAWRFAGREDGLVKIKGRWVNLPELENPRAIFEEFASRPKAD